MRFPGIEDSTELDPFDQQATQQSLSREEPALQFRFKIKAKLPELKTAKSQAVLGKNFISLNKQGLHGFKYAMNKKVNHQFVTLVEPEEADLEPAIRDVFEGHLTARRMEANRRIGSMRGLRMQPFGKPYEYNRNKILEENVRHQKDLLRKEMLNQRRAFQL